eukprot:gene3640-7257_t
MPSNGRSLKTGTQKKHDTYSKMKPSELLKQTVMDVDIGDYPMIVEFVNIQDNSTQVHSSVDIDHPLFQPSPVVVVFEGYAPFVTHDQKLFFRNNDRVPRRIKIPQPDSQFFEISAPRSSNGEALRQNKIAAGMEIYFTIKFKPQEVRDYSLDLVCVTEREKFVVPIRAIGHRPNLNFPDEINFGQCPVKSTARKMILVQNIGASVAKFRMRPSTPAFSCPSDDFAIEPGSSQMIEIFFAPSSAVDVSGDIEVEYSKILKCYIAMTGSGKNVEVSLSTPLLVLEPAYISLSSQKTLRINNFSDIPIQFAWKSYLKTEEEEMERDRLFLEIGRMENMEQAALEQGVMMYYKKDGNENGGEEEEDSEGSLSGDEGGLPFHSRAAQASLVRKYRNLRRALEKDSMHFVDDIFEISPCEGMVYPKSEIEITCTFRPDTAAQYSCMAYLDVSGREDRLHLSLTGHGIGPHAALSFDILDLGDVFINSEQHFELSITNKGDIPAEWSFISSLTKFGNKFSFTPKEGVLDVGSSQPIKLRFCSDILGEFNEYFRFGLQGNEEPLLAQVKGHVIGPTFHFDCKTIDFGPVSFDYLHSRTIRLVNTSKIPMTFRLYVPQDGSFSKKEFEVTPADGTLESGSSLDVVVDFIPTTVKIYAYTLVVDIQDVGEMLMSIPITAECIAASLRLEHRDIQYGECFVRYPYDRELTLINTSDIVYTTFSVLPQQHYTKTIAYYEAEPSSGVIAPGDKMSVKVTLTAEKLGNAKVPIMVTVSGSQEPPIQAALVCTAIGPNVTLDQTEIRWGNMECLKDFPRTLKITNDSLIPASFKIFLKAMRSKFDLSIREATLSAQETLDLVITANLDDTVVHNEELHILVHEGEHLMIPLSARGVGTTMYCKQDITTIDFGVQLTSTTFEKRITLENKGRRHQALRWINQTVREINFARAAKLKKLGKDGQPGFRIPKDLMPVEAKFTVTPSEIVLRPRTAVAFVFKGTCTTVGRIAETFILESRIGKERDMKQIMTANVQSDVVDPLLDFSLRELNYLYKWEKNEKPNQLFKQDVTLTNKTAVNLSFMLKTEMPFNLSSWEHVLSPGQSVDVTVEFLPFYRDDKTSHFVDKLLSIVYRGHPQKDSIQLKAEVIYPNLQFDRTDITFGCVLNETTKSILVKVTNWSKVDAAFHWYFLEDDLAKTRQRTKKTNAPTLTTTQVFDILPIRSLLGPGQSEDLEFVMFGHENNKFTGTAVCAVEGGPEYTIPLKGEASTVSYALDRNMIDFGPVLYTERKDEELGIINHGLVAFSFEARIENISSPGVLDVLPASGKVLPGERLKVILRVRPWKPEAIAECVVIRVAHFDPVKIMCYCQGIFPAIVATLPRLKEIGPFGQTDNVEDAWKEINDDARAKLLNPDKAKTVPPASTLSVPASGTTAVPPVYLGGYDESYPDEQDDILHPMMTKSLSMSMSKGAMNRASSKHPSQVTLEVELERLTLCHFLEEKVEELHLKPPTAATQNTEKSRKDTHSLQALLRNIDIQTITMATYVCDFGNIIMTTNKKRVFKIANAATAGPVGWVFDKRLLSSTGFVIDPEKVMRLPEGASVDFTVKFTAEPKLGLGRKEILLPLIVKDAPRLNVILTANVCIPEIEISSETIDFESCYLGFSRKMYFWLTNTSPVTAQWTLNRASSSKDACFRLDLDRGSIKAGQRIVVGVEFIPTDHRRYNTPLSLKVDMNGKKKALQLIGEGVAPQIRFDPPVVNLGPILPFSEGAEKLVTVFNDSERAIEIFSSDFDTVYKEEDAILLAVDIYDNDLLHRAPLRVAGDPLPQAILDAYKKTLATPSSSIIAVEVAPEDTVEKVGFEDPPIRVDGAPRDNNLQQDIIVVGPPLSGVTTHSKNLASKLQLPLKTIDQIIDDVASYGGTIGLKARQLLNRLSPDEEVQQKALAEELCAAAEKSKVEATETFKKDKKNKKSDVPPEVLQTPQVIAYQTFLEETSKWTAGTLAEVIKHRLSWTDAGYGVVIDSFYSMHMEVFTVIEGVRAAIAYAIVAKLMITGGDEGYTAHIACLHATRTNDLERINAIFKDEEEIHRNSKLSSRQSLKSDRSVRRKSTLRKSAIGSPSAAISEDAAPAAAGGATPGHRKSLNLMEAIDTAIADIDNQPPPKRSLMGDEFWIDHKTGVVAELSAEEVTGLDDDQRVFYKELFHEQLDKQLAEAQAVLQKISLIWSENRGLKSRPASEGGKVPPEKTRNKNAESSSVIYWDFSLKVLPLIDTIFSRQQQIQIDQSLEAPAYGDDESSLMSMNQSSLSAASIPGLGGGGGGGSRAGSSQGRHEIEYGIYEIDFDAEEPIESVFVTMNAILPAPRVPPPEKDALPLPRVSQIIRRPLPRPDRKRNDKFELLLQDDRLKTVSSTPSLASVKSLPKDTAKKSQGGKGKQTAAVVVEPPPLDTKPRYRWVIPPFGTAAFKIKFASVTEGSFDTSMGFEVTGRCEVPRIHGDPRNTFMRRVKTLAVGAPMPQHRFITSENFFSFGPSLIFKQAEWRLPLAEDASPEDRTRQDVVQANLEVIHLTNIGHYKCTVDLGFEDDAEELKGIFVVEPPTFELEEGETQDVKLWAFPTQSKDYKNNLIACVSNNPNPVTFDVRCCGVEPEVILAGPWDEVNAAAEKELADKRAEKTDAKKLKELEAKVQAMLASPVIDFDRMLLGKVEVRTIEAKNTSLLPVAWVVDLGEFKDSDTVTIFPLSGLLSPGATVTISLSVTANAACIIGGKFSFKYSDAEGGLLATERIQTKTMRVMAEVYKIQAVSLTATGAEEGGNEVDFGLLRVGDYVPQLVRMGNKGKYAIGYKISIKRAATAAMLTIEPSEGTIEPGQDAAITLTFCSKTSEQKMKGNKDIKVSISEPLTGEIVEEFPLLISMNAKFNRFRMQPSKGISFGAIRFDSATQTKSVEIRNDGQFDITYVVTPATAECNEIDSLDPAALTCFAFNIPAALRTPILGEGYMDRLLPAGKPGAGRPESKKDDRKKDGKDKSKAPAGKDKGKADPHKDPNASAGHPSIIDPDHLIATPTPKDPLLVGAFKAFPRVGYVQPGECAIVEVAFNPSGCDTARERLKFFISGSDMNDMLSQTIQSFEVIGDSCFPAIVTDDTHSIFEEQEVVGSLLDVIGGSEGQGTTKIEKMPMGKVVYCESEKMLVFGPVVCASGPGKGISERIKITNPTKIDAKVKFRTMSVEAATAAAAEPTPVTGTQTKGKTDKKALPKGHSILSDTSADAAAFSVQPETWDIPPHEYRYVNVFFNPTEIRSYRAVFSAEIDEEVSVSKADMKTSTNGRKLQFSLAGAGTMPCVSVDHPTERDEEGNLIVDFGKVHVMRTCRKKISIRNDGVMAATCLFDMKGNEDFIFQTKGSSVTLQPGEKQDLMVEYSPTTAPANAEGGGAGAGVAVAGSPLCTSQIKMSVLNNAFDHYSFKLRASSYACDAIIEVNNNSSSSNKTSSDSSSKASPKEGVDTSMEEITFDHINITGGPQSYKQSILLKSRSPHNLRFEMKADTAGGVPPNVLSFFPCVGHLAPNSSKEIVVTFTSSEAVHLDAAKIFCLLRRIEYSKTEGDGGGSSGGEGETSSLCGIWDDSMKSIRPATDGDLERIAADEKALTEYKTKLNDPKLKPKKSSVKGAAMELPAPVLSGLQLLPPSSSNGHQMVCETSLEPACTFAPSETQTLTVACHAVADAAAFKCDIPNGQIPFKSTYLYQSSAYSFSFENESNISLPVKWSFDNVKKRALATRAGTSQSGVRAPSRAVSAGATFSSIIPCPFTIEPEEAVVSPKSSQSFTVRFLPLEVDEFAYVLRGETLPITAEDVEDGGKAHHFNTFVRGTSKRPICHFDIIDSPDYLTRRQANMKNENGLNSPIEATDIRFVELESTGLRSRNTFRFHVINPTGENYEFQWEACGDPSPAWRCVLGAGMLHSGKRVEMIFEYLPDEMAVAESFYKFKLPGVGLEQIFLFAGKVSEPKVSFSTSKLDFHSVLVGGEGGVETIYLENLEHLMFNFSFDKTSLVQLEGTNGSILDISPKSGSIAPHGKVPITLTFKPQEEILYNFNINCEVKRKPKKLSLNVKGEGYAVHPVIKLEQDASSDSSGKQLMPLRPAPAVNYLDFGAVQVLDTVSRSMTVLNAGKYNFDYIWDTDAMGGNISLSGGKLCGTLQKAGELSYHILFSPHKETNLDGAMLSFTVAGKYTYNIVARGSGVKPALRFSFLHHDFGPCFITSPGGSTVVEETLLRIANHDPTANISVECTFQKTRALWAECQPTVLDPGAAVDIPIRFAPRDVKDYSFILPFIVNGTSKVNVTISGRGINARLELVNQTQRRLNFGVVDVHNETRRTVNIVNRAKKALSVQLLEDAVYGAGALQERFVTFSPQNEFILQPKEIAGIQIIFNPTRRVAQFTEDLNISYGGITRKLLSVSGKAQGADVSLDTDSMPFGTVVLDSQKVRKLRLDNTGDLPVSYEWVEATFGNHFRITPLSGKLAPGTETSFDVTFRPGFVDADIRQENITLLIPGLSSLLLTCSGMCVSQPSDSVQTLKFESLARKAQEKNVKLSNPSDKDWFVSPTLEGIHWHCPHELKVPARGSAELVITYLPVTMAIKPPEKVAPPPTKKAQTSRPASPDEHSMMDVGLGAGVGGHHGKLFVALPDGSAQLYNLLGYAGPPELSGVVSVETPAKKPVNFSLKLHNWISEPQTFVTNIEINEKPSPASFIVAANAVEVGPNGTKEFNARFSSYVEGITKATITFTNPNTGEYCFYSIVARTTTAEVLETISIESPVRQTARYVITADNPLPRDVLVTMGSNVQKPDEWWSCDSSVIQLKELIPFSGNAEASFEVWYRPLLPTKHPKDHLLTIMSKELGTFKYKLSVIATPPSLRQTVRFEVPLGSMQTESFLFRTYNPSPVTFSCSIKKADFFSVPKTLNVEAVKDWEGMEVKLPVSFEPTEIGETRDILTVSSPEGGEYLCEVIASCTAPLPQGPFNFTEGVSVDIPYRNCFNTNCKWLFSVDSPHFRLPVAFAVINAKTKGNCNVVFEPTAEALSAPGGIISAKLFIRCEPKTDIPPWVFYLRGRVDPSGAFIAETQSKAKPKK